MPAFSPNLVNPGLGYGDKIRVTPLFSGGDTAASPVETYVTGVSKHNGLAAIHYGAAFARADQVQLVHRFEEQGLEALKRLCAAYNHGEDNGSHIDLSCVIAAVDFARDVLPAHFLTVNPDAKRAAFTHEPPQEVRQLSRALLRMIAAVDWAGGDSPEWEELDTAWEVACSVLRDYHIDPEMQGRRFVVADADLMVRNVNEDTENGRYFRSSRVDAATDVRFVWDLTVQNSIPGFAEIVNKVRENPAEPEAGLAQHGLLAFAALQRLSAEERAKLAAPLLAVQYCSDSAPMDRWIGLTDPADKAGMAAEMLRSYVLEEPYTLGFKATNERPDWAPAPVANATDDNDEAPAP